MTLRSVYGALEGHLGQEFTGNTTRKKSQARNASLTFPLSPDDHVRRKKVWFNNGYKDDTTFTCHPGVGFGHEAILTLTTFHV